MSFLLGKAKKAVIWTGGAALLSVLSVLSSLPSAAAGALLDDPVRTVTSTASSQLPSTPVVDPSPTVRSVTSSVPDPVPKVSSQPALPSPPQVQTPPPPQVKPPAVEVPAVPKPQVQVAPKPQVQVAPKPQVQVAPKPSASVEAPSVSPSSKGELDSPRSADDSIGAVRNSVDSVAGVPAGTDARGVVSNDPTGPASSGARPASNGAGAGRVVPGAQPPSLERARQAPLRHWLARVWPAIALGPFADLLPVLREGLTGATILPVADLLRMMSGITELSSAPVAPSPARSSVPSSASGEHHAAPLPVGSEISIIVLLLAAATLTALLVFAVRQELGPRFRWPQ